MLMGDGWRELVTFSIWWRGGGNNTCWHHLVCEDRNWYKKMVDFTLVEKNFVALKV